MGYLKIHCGNCGGSWEIYPRDDWKADKSRQCPHCFSSVDAQTWDKRVLHAFAAALDANAELYKHHTGYEAPLFEFDIITR